MELFELEMLNTIAAKHLIDKGDGIVIGLSGGPDSMALTLGLLALKEHLNLKLAAVHLNHMYRGEDANTDQAFVRAFCMEHDIDFFEFCLPVEKMAKAEGTSFEEMGRKLRYEKFEGVRQTLNYQKIAVAQNQNDVVETFFINAFRGSGLEGLKSIAYKRGPYIIRPLLNHDRNFIEAYCEQKGIQPRIDKTNASVDYTRNRIRNELLPYVKEHFNERVEATIFRTTENLKSDNDYLNTQASEVFLNMVKGDENGKYIIMDDLFALHRALQTRVLLIFIKTIRGHVKNISRAGLLRVLALDQTNKSVEIDKNYTFYRSYNHLYFLNKNASLGNLEKKSRVDVSFMTIEDYKGLSPLNKSSERVYIDADKVIGSLQVRHRIEGDVFVPFGMKGSKKVKRFMVDEKIPAYKRNKILIVADEANIIWVAGYRISDLYKITNQTHKVMVLQLVVDC